MGVSDENTNLPTEEEKEENKEEGDEQEE